MTPLLEKCEKQAMRLPAEERAILAEHLIASLEDVDPSENERLWVKEAEARYEAYKRRELKAYSAEGVIREIRDSLE